MERVNILTERGNYLKMIEVKNLTKKYGSFVAVNEVSFDIAKGEIVGFLGPNGAGKTTTMRALTGYFPPTSGTCKIAGFDIEENPIEAKKCIGYLPENNPLYHEMKVIEYLEFIGGLREIVKTKDRIKEVAEICGIAKVISQTIGELSRGFRQRVGLAQSILHDPEILIMDEPTEGLDPNQVIAVRELIKNLARGNHLKEKTVMISTHILSEVEATCNRVLIINKGKIIADGSREELQTMSKGKEVVELELKEFNKSIISILKEQPFIENVELQDKKYELEAKDNIPSEKKDIREDLFKLATQKGWTILDLHKRIASLEDVFRELTRE